METGGYKGRSRELPKPKLREMVSKYLGVAEADIVTEYGMSELSSQAYEQAGVFQIQTDMGSRAGGFAGKPVRRRARAKRGCLQVFDLANI